MAFGVMNCIGISAASARTASNHETVVSADTGNAPDYSQKSCWYQIPDITKDVDTFFVYPTEYLALNDGDPDYASLDNPDMLEGVKNLDHKLMASVYEDATNVFVPYYRQASLRVQIDSWKKTVM